MTDIRAREPVGLGWLDVGTIPSRDPWQAGIRAYVHLATATQVLSELAMAKLPKSGGTGPQWFVSLVDKTMPEPRRPSQQQTILALCAFGMLGAEEDNHMPGNSRQFWMPIDPSERVDCECKADEDIIVEPDGFTWTNPKEGPCRGCENEHLQARLGCDRPCSLHRPRRVP